MKRQHITRPALLAWLCLAAIALTVHAQPQVEPEVVTTFDRWYVLQLSGEHAGYAHTTERRKGDRVLTDMFMSMTISRGATPINIEIDSWFVESEDGTPIEAASTVRPGAVPITTTAKFTEDGIALTTGQGPTAHTQQMPPLDPAYLAPAAAQRKMDQHIENGDTEFSVSTIDISTGVTPITMNIKVAGEENIEVFGKVVPAIAWDVNITSMPGITVKRYVDHDGRELKSTVQIMPGLEFTMIEADEQLAKAKVNPPQVMAQTLIHPDEPIHNPRQTRSAIYNVALKGNTDTALDLPRVGYQRVVFDDETTAAVILDLDQPNNAIDDLPTDADLESSNMIDHESKPVRALLMQAMAGVGDTTPDAEVASILRRFVYDTIDAKDLSVGLARASEVAQTAQGDCTEHAVLLAALLRARGIPARTVTGLIYADEFLGKQGIFGYHMWTQAWISDPDANGAAGGRWVDVDAVLGEHDFDAAHIALAVSSMSDGQMVNDMIAMLPTFGRLEIKVVEAE